MTNFRLDRFLTLYFFKYITRGNISSHTVQIPILMYHSISAEQEKSHPYYHVNTTPSIFDEQMRYLYNNKYSTINLPDLETIFEKKDSSKYIVITFDDGFRDFYTDAFPILNKYNFSATVFLPTAFINHKRLSFKGKECLTWNEVRRLSKEGIIFGSHTVSHLHLYKLKENEIEEEMKTSKEKIETETNLKIESFSYPYAFPENKEFEIHLKKVLTTYGYKNGVSTIIGTADKSKDKYFYPRLPVNSGDDLLFFQSKLQGAYNWLSQPQSIIKLLKQLRRCNNV